MILCRPRLGADPEANRRAMQQPMDHSPTGILELPAGEHVVAAGLRVPGGWTVRGAAGSGRPATWLTGEGSDGRPVLQVTGGEVAISDLGLRPPPSEPGLHGGDRGTAITVGAYLYDSRPAWITGVDIRRVHVAQAGRSANSIALMGAVHGVTVHEITVEGGHTGVAVHWGALGGRVDAIVGPTYHPNRLVITDLRVSDAVEGFYLSSVHDVRVSGACLRDVEMGFRLLPGDNTDRFHHEPGARIGERIEIADVCLRWTGDRYGVRVAGWGRSELDGVVSRLSYADTTIRDCVLRRVPAPDRDGAAQRRSWSPVVVKQADRDGVAQRRSWSPVVVEHADGVSIRNVRMDSGAADDDRCCRLADDPAGSAPTTGQGRPMTGQVSS